MSWTMEDIRNLSPKQQESIRRQLAGQPCQPLLITEASAAGDPAPQQGKAKGNNMKMTAPDAESEETIQAQAIALLERQGFIVLQTTHRYQRQACPECGAWFRPYGGYGSTPGVPDLIVSREAWPLGLWLGIEMKTADGPLSPAQELLKAQGRIVIARGAGGAVWLANSASDDFASSFFPRPVINPVEVAAAKAKLQKHKEAQQIAAARKKKGPRP